MEFFCLTVDFDLVTMDTQGQEPMKKRERIFSREPLTLREVERIIIKEYGAFASEIIVRTT
jgi:hypothetical protein